MNVQPHKKKVIICVSREGDRTFEGSDNLISIKVEQLWWHYERIWGILHSNCLPFLLLKNVAPFPILGTFSGDARILSPFSVYLVCEQMHKQYVQKFFLLKINKIIITR